ncbi:SDR family NAD(P)-dependent oxidoreductase [Paenibacillus taichungensis]|uniref:SDR family NAD(P)-dependent oxidoreductase n=1 Tax=Paenibacillus taichungensis TaxID=484184 RepID=A0A329QSL0_9BACL|nr:SDR family oxidoreductase [Paenibacillus taichungensis]RAW15267.1 SDR family NAD(P)-dependent oxidoreductase [Paenibacillus taichungensis]
MKILVTGATGHLGSLAVEALLKTVSAGDLAVSVRNPEKAEALRAQGVDVRQGDFDQPETLEKAFAGVDRLLLISTDGDNETRIRQHQAAVDAAKKAGVGFIAYTSVVNAEKNTLSLAEVHRATEQAIRESGIPYSFLRNNWYLENEAGSVQAASQGAPWVHATNASQVGWATRSDYAHAAAVVLTGEGHENSVYELSGKLRTQAELAAIVGEVLGQDIDVQNVDDAAYADIMKGAGLPDFVVSMLVDMQSAIREGALAVESDTLEKLLGRPAQPLSEGVKAILGK